MSAGLQLQTLFRLRLRLLRSPIASPTPPPTALCHVSDDVACHTPTSPEHKIPAMLTCPPAPKKSRPSNDVSCKRKLEFFEINGRDEIESFFKESFEDVKKKQRN